MTTDGKQNRGEPRVSDERSSERIAAVRSRVAKLRNRGGSQAEAEDVAWPTDLSAGQADESEWGTDPEEVARG